MVILPDVGRKKTASASVHIEFDNEKKERQENVTMKIESPESLIDQFHLSHLTSTM